MKSYGKLMVVGLLCLNTVTAQARFSQDEWRSRLREMISHAKHVSPSLVTPFTEISDSNRIQEELFATIETDGLTLEQKQSLLFKSCYLGFTPIVQRLVEDPEVDPTANDDFGRPQGPLRNAAVYGHPKIVRILLDQQSVDPSAGDQTAIVEAATSWLAGRDGVTIADYEEIVRMLLDDPRVDPSAQDNEGLVLSARDGKLGIVKLLTADTRVDPSARGNSPVIESAMNGHVKVVRHLLSFSQVDPQHKEMSPWIL